MATGGGYRNGAHKAPNLRNSSSFKSKLPPANVRRSSPATLGGGAPSGELRGVTSFKHVWRLLDLMVLVEGVIIPVFDLLYEQCRSKCSLTSLFLLLLF